MQTVTGSWERQGKRHLWSLWGERGPAAASVSDFQPELCKSVILLFSTTQLKKQLSLQAECLEDHDGCFKSKPSEALVCVALFPPPIPPPTSLSDYLPLSRHSSTQMSLPL